MEDATKQGEGDRTLEAQEILSATEPGRGAVSAAESAKQAILDQAIPVEKRAVPMVIKKEQEPQGKIKLKYSQWVEMSKQNEITQQLALDVLKAADDLIPADELARIKENDWYLVFDMGRRAVGGQRIGKRNTHRKKKKKRRR